MNQRKPKGRCGEILSCQIPEFTYYVPKTLLRETFSHARGKKSHDDDDTGENKDGNDDDD